MHEHSLPALLTVEEVMERYRLHDPRAARSIMRNAGGAKFGGRWLVRADRLDAFERALDQPRLADQSISNERYRPTDLQPLVPGELLT